MSKLIIKDLTFNKLQVLLGILVVAGLSFLPALAGREYVIVPFIMAPSLLFNQIVGKGCYLDDKNNAYVFLRSLPIPRNTIVFSKYVEAVLVLAISYTIIFGSNLVLKLLGQPLYNPDTFLLMIASILLIYFSLFLWLFFRNDFASAQHSAFVMIVAWIGVFKLQEYLNSSNMSLARIIHADILYVLLLIAATIFVVSCRLSMNIFATKE